MRKWYRLALIALALGSRPLVASEMDNLYEAQIPVASQAEADRPAALRAALEAVFIKVTGSRDAAKSPRIQEALRQPIKYLQQYFYQPLPPDPSAPPQAARNTQLLQARFDGAAINDVVRQAGIPLWGRTRPDTLLWLAVDDVSERFLLGGGGALNDAMRAAVDRESQRRGIPVLVPMMDMEDRNKLYFTDVWGDFQDAILQASQRYRARAVLVGRLLHEPTGWSGRWTLYQDGGNVGHWAASAAQWTDLIASGMDGAADELAVHYARPLAAEGEKTVDLVIANIRGLNDYDRALGYLRGLDVVQALQVRALEGDRLSLRLQLNSDRDSLDRLIGFGSTLVRDSGRTAAAPATTAPSPSGSQELSYRLLP